MSRAHDSVQSFQPLRVYMTLRLDSSQHLRVMENPVTEC